MKLMSKVISIVLIIACVLTILPVPVYAKGSYSAYLGTKTLTVGSSTKVTIKTKNAAGKFTVTSSNSSVAKVSTTSTWVDGSMDKTITVKGLKEGTATITIKPVDVTDNDMNDITKATSIKVTVKKKAETKPEDKPTTTTKSSDATLKELSSDVVDIDFKKDTTKYTVNVDKNTTTLNLKAIANSSKAKVVITGDENFAVGNNTVTVKVTAEDGTTKTYTITVVKSAHGFGPLVDLSVEGYDLNKEFEPDEYEYSIDAMGVSTVNVKYTKAQASTKVEIIGADNLKEGRNQIKVIAITANGQSTIYTINVNVIKTADKVLEKNNIMWLIIIIILVALVIIESLYIMAKDRIVTAKDEEEKTEQVKETKSRRATSKAKVITKKTDSKTATKKVTKKDTKK